MESGNAEREHMNDITGPNRREALGAIVAFLALSGCGVSAQNTQGTSGPVGQRPRPVVALYCEDDSAGFGAPSLCRALVQSISRARPGVIVRRNPNPAPPSALKISVERLGQGTRLTWESPASAPIRGEIIQTSGTPERVAEALLEGSAGLPAALSRLTETP